MIKKIFNKIKGKKKSSNNIMPIFSSNETTYKNRRFYKIDFSKLFKNNIFPNNFINIYIIIILLIIIVLFFIFGPIFRIKKIDIIRKDYLTNINIAYKSLDSIRGKSIFLVNFDNIKQKLKRYQPNIKNVKIGISFPNLINVKIGSYSGLFNTNIKGKNYIITENGIFIPIKKYLEINSLKIIYKDLNNIQILDYKKILDSKMILSISYLINKLRDNILSLNMEKYYYYVNQRELHIITKSGIRLIYDLNSDINNQIRKTVILNKQYLKLINGGVVYIDFRVKDKVYYCTNKTKSVCLKHIKRIYGK